MEFPQSRALPVFSLRVRLPDILSRELTQTRGTLGDTEGHSSAADYMLKR